MFLLLYVYLEINGEAENQYRVGMLKKSVL